MRIVFMGTPESAVPSLQRLLTDGHDIVAVWTQPDKPAGRGEKMRVSPVKAFALEHGLHVEQPRKIKIDESKRSVCVLQRGCGGGSGLRTDSSRGIPVRSATRLYQRSFLIAAALSWRCSGELGHRQW